MESISEAHRAGSPCASSKHLHDGVSQSFEHNFGSIGSVSESAGVKFCAARAQWPDKMKVVAAVHNSICFISISCVIGLPAKSTIPTYIICQA